MQESKPNPRISIIIAAYNVERELRLLLKSIKDSTYQNFEVCICEDNSPDRTLDTIKDYQSEFDLNFLHNEVNRGVTFSRNRAASLAKTDFLLFLDADIRLYPDTIQRLVERMCSSRVEFVQGVYSPQALDSSIFSKYYALFAGQSFLEPVDRPVKDNLFNGWLCLCHKSAFERVGGHQVIPKGMELENEILGRKIIANGFQIITDNSIMVDHHWGGFPKLMFIFTRRIYWWVKVFFVDRMEFETFTTNKSYGYGTLCLPAAFVSCALGLWASEFLFLSALFLLAFVAAYFPFYRFVIRRNQAAFLPTAVLFSMFFAWVISVSAVYSGIEEVFRLVFQRKTTVPQELINPQ